jgi:DNA (cytosine-5)-methyltransferase 1
MRRIIYETRPRWVIGENVAGFVSLGLDRSIDDLEGLGYEAETFSIPAYACGLPTLERHVWIVAAANALQGASHKRDNQDMAAEKRLHSIRGGDPGTYGRWRLPEARVCGVGERVPGRVDRLRALGNAVPPPVVAEIFRAIMSPYNQRE